ncbi:response regulator [Phormidium tenue FACHB-886]|nr:response regulator [Phormidium tenue FACHB-886]
MMVDKISTVAGLSKQLQICSKIPFNGRLDLNIHGQQVRQSSLFFHRGFLTWGASNIHPSRRWYRQLSQYCPQLSIDSTPHSYSRIPDDYFSLAKLVRQGKVSQEQMIAVVAGQISEILFDIIQSIQYGNELRPRTEVQLVYRQVTQNFRDSIDSTLVSIPVDQVWQQAEQLWTDWQQASLVHISPNLAPVVWEPEELRLQAPANIYNNLTLLLDGERTLRDLAVKLRKSPLHLIQSIKPYIHRRMIGLIEVGDLLDSVQIATPSPQKNTVASPNHPVSASTDRPLIAYIDDSQFDALTMNHVLSQADYRFINIQEPLQALPILLELKPSLIFLDLVMPNTNGYEICTQIRRASAFKNTPVIIVTSSDGIIDRVRAKLVGSSGFIAKPITLEKVLKVLRRHLPYRQAV